MKRLASVFLTLLFCLVLLPTTALADIGPKPSLTITVIDPPEGEYYLDLLIPEEERGDYENLRDPENYDELALSALFNCEAQGWYPAYAGGTKAPLFGGLRPDEDGKHRFTYWGLPDAFRIVVAQPNNGGCLAPFQTTEEVFTRTDFATELIYDFAKNTMIATPNVRGRALEFAATLLPTLLIEGAVLLLFRFKLRENTLVFLIVNILTQLFLHLALGLFPYPASYWFSSRFLRLLFMECIILAAESVAYIHLLKGHGKVRRAAYALSANLLSFAATFVTLDPVLRFFKSL